MSDNLPTGEMVLDTIESALRRQSIGYRQKGRLNHDWETPGQLLTPTPSSFGLGHYKVSS